MNFGIIGYGYWGPNIVRNLIALKETKVRYICDHDSEALSRAQQHYPNIPTTHNHEDVLTSEEVEVVAIVTPVSTHYALAKAALEHNKHIFVEKPFTANIKQAEELISLAKAKNRLIMVDHTFLFTGAVRRIKEEIDSGALGELYYIDSTRVNLGLFQQDINVVWDLAPHDFSIVDYIIDAEPMALSAHGIDHFDRGFENIAHITVYYDKKFMVHLNVNWLSPVKIRSTLISGSKKMLVWDDLNIDEKIKIYDKGVDVDTKEGMYSSMVDYRMGDMSSPHILQEEALKKELLYFVECIQKNQTPFNDGHAGLRIVKMLELAERSIKSKGQLVHF